MRVCPCSDSLDYADDVDLLFDPEVVGPPRPEVSIERFPPRLRYYACEGFWANGDPKYVYVWYTPIEFHRFLPVYHFPVEIDEIDF